MNDVDNFSRIDSSGESILAIVNSMEFGRVNRIAILKKYEIAAEPGKWYPMQKVILAFNEIFRQSGEFNLFIIGKAIVEHAKFPPMHDLKEALESVDVAYHMNHRLDGKIMYDIISGIKTPGIGNYLLSSYSPELRKAIMRCTNPYPSRFDEGIITQLVRKFRPGDSLGSNVRLDDSKESRSKGAKSCTYLIEW